MTDSVCPYPSRLTGLDLLLVWSQALAALAQVSSVPGPLDGLRFNAGIVKTETGGSGDDPLLDTLEFANGMFSSAICERYNFVPGDYWVRQQGQTVHFLAELNSPTDGRMIWQGKVHDGKLEDSMRWIGKRWYWTVDASHQISGRLETGFGSNRSAVD